ncbi:hypothetical protein AXG93_1217s1680 [Marchantia polymorpha subsp. ruderalis]|uniref:non-specific serine/threonine protein kinase n=1 Tax=Marchantia polymorpha subsp. ruderalis TaxID=1480154 RepID=A0A176VUZ8_MARPO|nr:hypothetical protein AXG93_1217s1680 [Marchantia polymorpha subsp. ruderalis]
MTPRIPVNEKKATVKQILFRLQLSNLKFPHTKASIKNLTLLPMAWGESSNAMRNQVQEVFGAGGGNGSDSTGLMEALLRQSEIMNEQEQSLASLVPTSSFMDKLILQCMGRSLHVISVSGQITYWNPMAERLFGYSAEQAVGQSAVDLLCNNDNHDYAVQICERTKSGISWSGRFPLRTSGGEDFTGAVCASPLISDKGELFGIIAICSRLDSYQYLIDQPKEYIRRAGKAPMQPVPELPPRGYSGHIGMSDPEREGHKLSESQNTVASVRNVTENASTSLVLASDLKVDQSVVSFRNVTENASTSLVLASDLKVDQSVVSVRNVTENASTSLVLASDLKVDQMASGRRRETIQHFTPVHSWSHVNNASSSSSQNFNLPGSSASSQGPEPDQMPLAGFEIPWREIRFGARIGEGSCGTVYRATWLGSDVAVKLFSGQAYCPEVLDEFRQEVSIMKAMRHPNVLLFMGAITEPRHMSIVTEFVPRGSLFRILHRSGQGLSWNRRLAMALDIALGMNYLHNRSPPILHRDLKSSNLLVTEHWRVKVGDFGLSRLKSSRYLTRNSDKGTAQWMAPEVLRDEPYSEKSDVYSFGIILWELATRKIPWGEMSILEVVGAVGMLDRRLDMPEEVDIQRDQGRPCVMFDSDGKRRVRSTSDAALVSVFKALRSGMSSILLMDQEISLLMHMLFYSFH